MQKRKLGNSALDVSVVGLGGNNFGGRIDFAAAERVVHRAIALGVNLIDTADSYGNRGGSEEALGRILGDRRKDILLATKFGLPMDDTGTRQGASRRYVMQAAEASLKRLRTDWIDRYQLHRLWGVGLGVIYQDDMFAAIDNAVTLPGFTRFDAGVFFTLNDHLRAQVNVENLFDEEYFITSHSNNNISPGSPRAVRASMTAGF